MLQNVTNPRVPKIIEKELQGKTQGEIAHEIGVSRMTIYRDRQTPLYETMINQFFTLYTDTLKELITSDQTTIKLEALKELGRIYRAGMTKHTQHTEDRTLTANINITEQRKRKEKILKTLELSEDQYRRLENTLTDTP